MSRFLFAVLLATGCLLVAPSTQQTIKGSSVSGSDYRFLVRLHHSNSSDGSSCSGVLAGKNWVVTTTWCAKDSVGFWVCGGEVTADPRHCPSKRIAVWKTHHSFRDIALVKLLSGFNEGGIAEANILKSTPAISELISKKCKVVGFTNDAEGQNPKLLQVAMKIVPCSSSNMICAKEESDEECMGEAGSPLMYGGIIVGLFTKEKLKNCGANSTEPASSVNSEFESIKTSISFLESVIKAPYYKHASKAIGVNISVFLMISSNLILNMI